MMIAARNAFLMGGAKLPYDAEVEYLESTGTQYIDTGVVPGGEGTSVDCVFSISVNGNFSPIIWTRGANATDRAYCFEVEQGQQSRWDYANYGPLQRLNTVPLNKRATLTINNGTATVNGIQLIRESKEFIGAGPMILCNFCNYVNGVRQMISANVNPVRMYSCKVFSSGLFVRDFIPVRIGTGSSAVGYLYDRANPTGGPLGNGLYGNSGTGAFIVGPDN
jgi:hypothetical protein